MVPWPGWGHQLIGDVAYAIADDYTVYMVVRDPAAQALVRHWEREEKDGE